MDGGPTAEQMIDIDDINVAQWRPWTNLQLGDTTLQLQIQATRGSHRGRSFMVVAQYIAWENKAYEAPSCVDEIRIRSL